MTKQQKQEHCPNKEHWFGEGEEAQAKPAGFKFKRGTLLKVKDKGVLSNYSHNASYQRFEPYGRKVTVPQGFDEDTIFLIYDYNSEEGKIRMWDEYNRKNTYVPTVKHTFTFLFGERWDSITLEVWGLNTNRDMQNEMFHKARKFRKPPKKKRKKYGGGFAFDEEKSIESSS